MRLTALVSADVHRDGGSYGASFETDEGRLYGIWLQRSRMPDAEGLHHRWLFVWQGEERPADCLPVVTGSREERELLALLDGFLAAHAAQADAARLARLHELIRYIMHRDPCLPNDLIGWRRA